MNVAWKATVHMHCTHCATDFVISLLVLYMSMYMYVHSEAYCNSGSVWGMERRPAQKLLLLVELT